MLNLVSKTQILSCYQRDHLSNGKNEINYAEVREFRPITQAHCYKIVWAAKISIAVEKKTLSPGHGIGQLVTLLKYNPD